MSPKQLALLVNEISAALFSSIPAANIAFSVSTTAIGWTLKLSGGKSAFVTLGWVDHIPSFSGPMYIKVEVPMNHENEAWVRTISEKLTSETWEGLSMAKPITVFGTDSQRRIFDAS